MIKLIASDMDGTLLNSQKQLPPNFYEVISRLKQQGVKFCIGSGRTWGTLKRNFDGHTNELNFICENGAFVVENENPTFESVINPQLVKDIVKVVQVNMHPDINIMLCGPDGVYLTDYMHNEKMANILSKNVQDQHPLGDIDNFKGDVFKIAIADMRGAKLFIEPLLKKHFGDKVEIIVSGPYFTDCMNIGISKGRALEFMQKELNISEEETMVFGDYFNDVSMLSRAKYSFVMENAPKDMFQHGNYKCPSNEENGVMKTVEKYVLNNEEL